MPSANQGTDLVISSESDATIMLRFPVADLRKAQSERLAWWRRNLRHEILELQVTKPLFRTKIGATSPDGASVMEFTCRSLRGKFYLLCIFRYITGRKFTYPVPTNFSVRLLSHVGNLQLRYIYICCMCYRLLLDGC